VLLFAIHRLDITGIAPQPFDQSLQPRGHFLITARIEISIIRRLGKQRFQHHAQPSIATKMPAILFGLDGTLIDSNYRHVNAWSETLLAAGIVSAVETSIAASE
jgi:hypothetical protein